MAMNPQEIAESTGALGALGVNGKLFLAQLVNFGIVFFVMWKWVYTPLLKAMDARTAKIEQGLKDADTAAHARGAAEKESHAVIAEARMEAKRIIEDATKSLETDRAATVAKAKAEVERVVAQGKERLASEQQAMIAEVRSQAASLVTLAAEKVLREKLDTKTDVGLVSAALKDVA